ncbi:SLAIN motif-containing protein 1-like isoform X2 [Conger conger]|uniref:SLAIN motif-containing protein 1-like isoform X2 n=1 Tax=Conger conger TaxID=82655 RepID=UPI002A5B0B98|nr:SLAIN motif-containing protein 1-like isoform X2 [Conger conger]
MDATVLHPQMMADVNCNQNIANAELEVKKLQELVRKLEKQNEQLRTRANAVGSCRATSHILQSSPACLHGSSVGAVASPVFPGSYYIASPASTLLCPSALDQYCVSEEPYAYFNPHSVTYGETEDINSGFAEPTVLDEVEILDLNSILPCNEGSEDTWLYVPPNARKWTEFSLSPLQWSRQVLDHPRAEVEAAKRTLCHRLAQAKKWRGVLSSRVPPVCPPVAGVPPLCSSPKPCSRPTLLERPASFSSSSHTPPLPTPRTNRKDYSGLAERSPSFLYHSANQSASRRLLPLSRQSSVDSELSASELEDSSIAMGYKLQDLTDVQIMARLQEESLRQDYASTSASTNRRSSSFSFRPRRPMSSQLDLSGEEEYDHTPLPEPRAAHATPLQRGLSHSLSFSGSRDPRRSPSTPQYLSSLLFQQNCGLASPGYIPGYMPDAYSQGHRAGRDHLQRSMPNLVRAPSMPSVPSVLSVPSNSGHSNATSSMRSSQSFDSSNGLARIQSTIPSPGPLQYRVQSVGNFSGSSRPPLKAMAYVSPTIKGSPSLPTAISAQSSIPLPNKPSTPPTTGRSALPRPASFIGAGAIPRSKIAQPLRSLLAPPKSVSALSTLRDVSWRDGCY